MKRTKSLVRLLGLIGISMSVSGCFENVYDSYDSYKTDKMRSGENKHAVSIDNDSFAMDDNKERAELKVEVVKHECFMLDERLNMSNCFASPHLNYEVEGKYIRDIGWEKGMGICNGQNIALFFVWDIERDEKYNGIVKTRVELEMRKKSGGLVATLCNNREISFSFNDTNYGRIGDIVLLKAGGDEMALYELKATSTLIDKYGNTDNKKEINCYVFVDGVRELSKK